MIIHNIIVAVRNIWKYKTQNLISILGLSVALLCFSICLYCTRYIYSTDHCFENLDRLVQVTTADKESGEAKSYTFCDFHEELEKLALPEVETYVYTNFGETRPYNIEVKPDKLLPYSLRFMETQPSFLQAFTPKVILGSWEQASHAPNSVILAESTAKRIFGETEKAIGKSMYLTRKLGTSPETTPREGGIAYTIQAVVEDLPENTSLNFMGHMDAWVLNDSEGLLNSRYKRSMASGTTYALLKEGVSTEDFIRKANALKQVYNFFDKDQYLSVHGFNELFWKDSSAPYFAITTTVIGILILLVGMLNFFHFLTGSFVTRIREYSLRQVNGAKSHQLWIMLLVQATLALLCSGLFTMMMMELLTPFLSIDLRFFALDIDRPTLMKQAGTYLLGLWVCCMLAAAFVVWRVKRITILKGLFGGGGVYGKHRVRNVLLGIQLFICWIFFSSTVALYLQSQKTGNAILSTLTIEEKENIYSISMMEYTFMTNDERKSLVTEFGNIAGVKDILPAQEHYTGGSWSTSIFPSPERTRGTAIQVSMTYVAPNFFEFMNMPIQTGIAHRTMNEMVVSSNFEKNLGKEVLGQNFYNWEQEAFTVTGICAPITSSVHRRISTDYDPTNYIYYPFDINENLFHCYVKCEPGQKKKVGEAIEKILRDRLPESVEVKIQTMWDDIRQGQSMEFELRGIIGFLAIVTLTIVLLGIYAAITLDTENRQKEVAIRKINGAGMKDIVLLFARLYATMLIVTFMLAIPIVSALAKEFSQLYTIFIDMDFGFYACVFLCITVIVTLTVGFRIYRITKINPAEIIKKE